MPVTALLLSRSRMKAPSSSKSHSARILLIDDNKLGLTARKAVLEELGYVITTAGSGHEGLKRFRESAFDLVITDYKMPRMNGVQLIQSIRREEPEIPIILLSGFADALGLDEKTTGADVVIQKSANEVTHMVRAVGKLLRQRKPSRKPPASQRSANARNRRQRG